MDGTVAVSRDHHTGAADKSLGRRLPPVRVFVLDEALRADFSLTMRLSQDAALSVVGQAGTVATAIAGAAEVKPDIMVLGPDIGAQAARRAARVLRASYPELPLLWVTDGRDRANSLQALFAAGIYGQVAPDVSDEMLSLAIRTVAAGASFLCPRLTRMGTAQSRSRADERVVDSLSPQERRILPLLAEGKTNREIACALRLSEKTVKNYLANMFEKLRITRRTQAVTLYLRTAGLRPTKGTGSGIAEVCPLCDAPVSDDTDRQQAEGWQSA
jgi:two-component system, NarL family, response regulator DevR